MVFIGSIEDIHNTAPNGVLYTILTLNSEPYSEPGRSTEPTTKRTSETTPNTMMSEHKKPAESVENHEKLLTTIQSTYNHKESNRNRERHNKSLEKGTITYYEQQRPTA